MKTIYRVSVMLILLVVLTQQLFAQRMNHSLEMLCQRSTDIVKAEVLSNSSYWNEDKEIIYSDVKIKILEKFSGKMNRDEEVTFTILGGSVGEFRQFLSEQPGYSPGEKAVLFLKEIKHKERKDFAVYGLAQGKFKIKKDKTTNEDMVIRELMQAPLQVQNNGLSLNVTHKKGIKLKKLTGYIKQFTAGNNR